MEARTDDSSRPLLLTVTRSGENLIVSLSDSRSIALVDSSVSPRGVRRGTYDDRKRSAELGASAAQAGKALFDDILPPRIGAVLRNSVPRELLLQLDRSVAGFAWEAAFDGVQFLGVKFAMSRHIIAADAAVPTISWQPPTDVCRVLVISDTQFSTKARSYRTRLLASLRSFSRLGLTIVDTAALDTDKIRDLLNKSDIVHYITFGSEPHAPFAKFATLSHPPRLIVHDRLDSSMAWDENDASFTQPCIDAVQVGLNVLTRSLRSADPDGSAFFDNFYHQISAGKRFATAAQIARAFCSEQPTADRAADLRVAYYGDATLCALSIVGDTSHHDSLRQVTTMSHDLVDSTGLIVRLGAEDYTELLGQYHQRCALIVREHGGISDDPQGDDGIMCYFGVHVAEEDAAAQSIRAAMKILEAMAKLGVSVRVGINTGRVVIRSGQPIGVAVHVAARLQSVAQPGTIVVGDSTRRLAQERFELASLGAPLSLKGVEEPLAGFRVVRELPFAGSDIAMSTLTPFVGREGELATLEEHWQAACRGTVKAVVISGEAGIGKSRLVHEFRSRLTARNALIVECRCSPRHTSSAFYPVIGWLRRALRIQDEDSAETNLRKLEASEVSKLGVNGAAAVIATLLSIPLEGAGRTPKRSAEKQRQMTLDVLVRWMVKTTQANPLCLIVEDVQWLDPSSREFLDRLIEAASALPLLALLTWRKEMA